MVHHPTLGNFWYLITYPNFQSCYLNSVMITIATVVVSMVISFLAARRGWASVAVSLTTGVFLIYLDSGHFKSAFST